MPSISVIVPVYKVEAYLGRCVDSILSQTFPDFELILVDDGSPDNCGQLCEDYAQKDGRIHVIHQENGGLSAARNSGIDWVFAHSDSQWLTFIDSDDWVEPEFLELLSNGVSETSCKIGICDFYRTSGLEGPNNTDISVRIFSAEEYYCRKDYVSAVAVCKLYHRSLFTTLRYPVGKLHEDEFTTYRMIYEAEKVAVMSAQLYAYYWNPDSITLSKWNPRRMHVLEAVEQQIAFAQKENHPMLLHKAIEQYIYSTDTQLENAKQSPEFVRFCPELRKKLRLGLKLGRESGVFPLTEDRLWAYEKAYPVKPLWWLYYKVRKP